MEHTHLLSIYTICYMEPSMTKGETQSAEHCIWNLFSFEPHISFVFEKISLGCDNDQNLDVVYFLRLHVSTLKTVRKRESLSNI